jgi:hypothetical protein
MADTQADLQIKAEAKLSEDLAKTLVTKQLLVLKNMAITRAKIVDGTATQEDRASFYKDKQTYDDLDQQLIAIGQLPSDQVAALKEEQRQAKLKRIKGNKGTLSSAKPDDLFEYILRTQALNPYSRERACDIEFMDLLLKVATETKNESSVINALRDTIKSTVSG